MEKKDYIEPIPTQCRKRRRKAQRLTDEEILQIAHKSLIQKEKHNEIAKEYRISVPRVSQIVGKLKKNSNVLEEMESKQDFKSNVDSCIRHVI